MAARTEAALRSWRAAGVRLVVVVEEGRKAAAGVSVMEKRREGAAVVFLSWRREGKVLLWGRAVVGGGLAALLTSGAVFTLTNKYAIFLFLFVVQEKMLSLPSCLF